LAVRLNPIISGLIDLEAPYSHEAPGDCPVRPYVKTALHTIPTAFFWN